MDQAYAEWRLRTQRRDAIYDKLIKEFGVLGVLTQGSLLQVCRPGSLTVERLAYRTRYREVIAASEIANVISERTLKLLYRLPKQEYERLESAFAALGSGILLAVGPNDSVDLVHAVNRLKIWVVNHGCRNTDQVTEYIKWLIKAAQAVALDREVPVGESYFPGYNFKTKKVLETPFKGPLSFIEDLLMGRRERIQGLKLEEARSLAQIASCSRALPFPSYRQATKSVLKTLDLVTDVPKPLSQEERKLYLGGLEYMGRFLGPFSGTKTHSSLTNSGSWERSQSEGGRAQEILEHVKPICQIELTASLVERIVDQVDVYSEPVLAPISGAIALDFIKQGKDSNRSLTLGDVLYVPGHEMLNHLEKVQLGYLVPKYLGNIVAAVCGTMLHEYGSFSLAPSVILGEGKLFLFPRGSAITHEPSVDSIPVKAACSEEGGMKTRLVTAAPAALTQVGQLMRHTIASDLGKDPFLRVGFEEADKLWETLKAYRRYSPKVSPTQNSARLRIISRDLEEATYRMPHEVMGINHGWMTRRYGQSPVWRVFGKLFAVFPRTIDLTDIRKKGYEFGLYPDNPTSTSGSFMGDSLSFMHLTLMMSSCIWQAASAAHFGSVTKRPDLRYFEGWISRPLGQVVGDDAVVLGATQLFCDVFTDAIKSVNGKMSKIDSQCVDMGTFTENWFCIPVDDSEQLRINYPEDSLFGEIWFLDTIKGSLLSGHAKVKADGASPFIGQARMLSKQILWHPIEWMRRVVPTILWARNFMEARFMGTINPHLPISLGGLEIALGKMDPITDPHMRDNYACYLEAMLQMPIQDFLKWQILLTGISRANPKGVPWSNDEFKIAMIVSKVQTFAESNVLSDIPLSVHNKGRGEVQRFMAETMNLTSVRFLTDALTRLEAFKAFWDGKAASQPFMSITTRKLRPRFKSVWTKIREQVTPVTEVTSRSWNELGKKFDQRTWGLLFSQDDPAFNELYEGMSTLSVQWGRLSAYA